MQYNQQWLADYSEVLGTLSPDQLGLLAQTTALNIEFKDPFNHTTDQASFLALMADMFDRLDRVRFDIDQQHQNGQTGFITWTFSASSRLTGEFSVQGCSHLEINDNGLIARHYDYWDASVVMQTLPLVGRVIGAIRFKMRGES